MAAGQELAGGGEDDEVVRLGDLGCYNQHWKVSLLIQAACMACFVGIFLVVQSRHVNAKGGQKERFRFRWVSRPRVEHLPPQPKKGRRSMLSNSRIRGEFAGEGSSTGR